MRVFPEVYMRDDINDIGNIPSGGSSRSPDIIVKNKEVVNASEKFGHYSGTINRYDLSDNVEFGNANYIYIRAFNKSPLIAHNSHVDLFWSKPSTLVLPKYWTFIGKASLPALPNNQIAMVSKPIEWNNAPNKGHYCFIGLIHNPFDSAPDLSRISSIRDFRSFIRNNNNVAWRNFNVVDNIPNISNEFNSYPFYVRGPEFDLEERISLEVCCELPEGSYAWVTFDDSFQIKSRVDLEINSCNTILSEVRSFPIEALFNINYFVPKDTKPGDYYIYARQLFEGDEIGRITWKIEAKY
ncbi:hypothetical protein L0668_11470 [Paraglaciecola aquimarina]|uniref:Uncharacterized protein n=1 Tax=Paraglaciecola algarum TaxID=3050085 RepID=A0ABS9DAA8_9ALTE|nr:hypothetical protein [Paraglaciecola sp. G1-23]MCF2948729.1 hypothetical protein [Paraglaciecola sp. G1-23]